MYRHKHTFLGLAKKQDIFCKKNLILDVISRRQPHVDSDAKLNDPSVSQNPYGALSVTGQYRCTQQGTCRCFKLHFMPTGIE